MNKKNSAFTLAEVLITILIIGIVATLTIPTVMRSYKRFMIEKQLVTFQSTLERAIKMAEAEHGAMKTWDLSTYAVSGDPKTLTTIPSRNAFINKYLMPYLHTRNKDAGERYLLTDIGYNKPWKYPNGSEFVKLNTQISPILLNNGVVIIPVVQTSASGSIRIARWLTLHVDINGPSGDNVIGKDIFSFNIPLKDGYKIGIAGENSHYSSTYDRFEDTPEQTIRDNCKSG